MMRPCSGRLLSFHGDYDECDRDPTDHVGNARSPDDVAARPSRRGTRAPAPDGRRRPRGSPQLADSAVAAVSSARRITSASRAMPLSIERKSIGPPSGKNASSTERSGGGRRPLRAQGHHLLVGGDAVDRFDISAVAREAGPGRCSPTRAPAATRVPNAGRSHQMATRPSRRHRGRSPSLHIAAIDDDRGGFHLFLARRRRGREWCLARGLWHPSYSLRRLADSSDASSSSLRQPRAASTKHT